MIPIHNIPDLAVDEQFMLRTVLNGCGVEFTIDEVVAAICSKILYQETQLNIRGHIVQNTLERALDVGLISKANVDPNSLESIYWDLVDECPDDVGYKLVDAWDAGNKGNAQLALIALAPEEDI